jgi:osmoprotectant transport system substrate-binding protein
VAAWPRIRVGSANFGEQVVLAEVYAQALEGVGFRVERRLRLGTREIVEPALESGQIDIAPEYVASMLAFVTRGASTGSSNVSETTDELRAALLPRGLSLFAVAPAENNNGFVVTRATSQAFGLTRLSDLADASPHLVLGAAPECPKRPFCLLGLESTYGVHFKAVRPLDSGGPLTVAALDAGEIDVAALYSTDPIIEAKGLVLLEDDRALQHSENIVPVVRAALSTSAPAELRSTIDGVSERLTTADVIDLNRKVVIDRDDPEAAAASWLQAHGIHHGRRP